MGDQCIFIDQVKEVGRLEIESIGGKIPLRGFIIPETQVSSYSGSSDEDEHRRSPLPYANTDRSSKTSAGPFFIPDFIRNLPAHGFEISLGDQERACCGVRVRDGGRKPVIPVLIIIYM
jgi:hypothetical protein